MSIARLNPEDLARLRRIVAEYFQHRGEEVRVDDWEAVRADGGTYGLVNLFQRAAELDPAEWEAYLTWHFDTLRGVEPSVPDDYSLASPNLRIRLADDQLAAQHHPRAVRRLCEGLSQVLVVRFDSGCFTLPGGAWDRWTMDPEQVWGDARERTLWDEPRNRRYLQRDQARICWIGGGFFASSLLLDLDRFLHRRHRHGAVAAVPTADACLWAPVDPQVPLAARGILQIAASWWADGPNAISPDLFWYREGRLERIVEISQGEARRCWSSSFSRALAEVEAESAA